MWQTRGVVWQQSAAFVMSSIKEERKAPTCGKCLENVVCCNRNTGNADQDLKESFWQHQDHWNATHHVTTTTIEPSHSEWSFWSFQCVGATEWCRSFISFFGFSWCDNLDDIEKWCAHVQSPFWTWQRSFLWHSEIVSSRKRCSRLFNNLGIFHKHFAILTSAWLCWQQSFLQQWLEDGAFCQHFKVKWNSWRAEQLAHGGLVSFEHLEIHLTSFLHHLCVSPTSRLHQSCLISMFQCNCQHELFLVENSFCLCQTSLLRSADKFELQIALIPRTCTPENKKTTDDRFFSVA